MYCNMYQGMYVEKTLPELVDFTYYGIGIFFFAFFLRSTKSAARSTPSVFRSRNERDRSRGDGSEQSGTIPNKSAFLQYSLEEHCLGHSMETHYERPLPQ